MRIAHLSDLHLLNLEGAIPFRLLNKRLTGYVNLRFHRTSVHKPYIAAAAAHAIQDLGVDHVVITGDVSNLALEGEFQLVQKFLDDDLAIDPSRISLVPGNHDMYTRGAHASQRFQNTFAPFLKSDLPELTPPGDVFPFVHLRGPAAIIGVSTALPRLPLVASGAVGQTQLDALERVLAHPEVRSRTVVLMQHHPLYNPESRTKTWLNGLDDAAEEQRLLGRLSRGLVLHGHLHRRVHREVRTADGRLDVVGATSASLIHTEDARMGGFNVYEIEKDGSIATIGSMRIDPATRESHETSIPRA